MINAPQSILRRIFYLTPINRKLEFSAQLVERLHVCWIGGIPESRLRQGSFLRHQLIVAIIIDESDTASDTGFPIHEPPGEEAYRHPLVDKQIDIPTHTFGMDNPEGEHFDMH